MKKTSKILLLLMMIPVGISAQSIVVTNGWTAAFAGLAGARDIEVLAPYEMKHPPEYEISLKELQMVADADFLIFAGYEAMMGRIKEAMGPDSSVELIQITTVNSQPVIHESVMKIARKLGTEAEALKNLEEIDTFFDLWRKDLTWHDDFVNSVIVHFHQQGPAKSLGFNVSQVFGPAAPSLAQIKSVLDEQPKLIIDNYHNPVSSSFLEMKDPPAVVSWINFPGSEGTVTLMDVLEYNRSELNKILE